MGTRNKKGGEKREKRGRRRGSKRIEKEENEWLKGNEGINFGERRRGREFLGTEEMREFFGERERGKRGEEREFNYYLWGRVVVLCCVVLCCVGECVISAISARDYKRGGAEQKKLAWAMPCKKEEKHSLSRTMWPGAPRPAILTVLIGIAFLRPVGSKRPSAERNIEH